VKVLVACEYSGVSRRAFAALGHDVLSADFLPSEDNSPYHYQGDCFDLIDDQSALYHHIRIIRGLENVQEDRS